MRNKEIICFLLVCIASICSCRTELTTYQPDDRTGSSIFEKECSECHKRGHLLSPPEANKSPEEWRKTISRMMNKSGEIISDKNIDILISYHIKTHNKKVAERFKKESETLALDSNDDLFEKKCSTCHSLEKSVHSFRDKKAWQKTIETMAGKSDGIITENDVSKLVNLHVEIQKKEQELFTKNCTRCHGQDVALGIDKTDDEWKETAKEMMAKNGKGINKEELEILTHYHKRYEKTLSDLSVEKCSKCHDPQRTLAKMGTMDSWEKTINLMNQKEGGDITHTDVKKLIAYHLAQQTIEQEIFEKDCSQCHQSEETLKKKISREEWRKIIRQMMSRTEKMITNEEVDTLINYHIRRNRE